MYNHDSSPKFYLKGAMRKGIDRVNHAIDLRSLPTLSEDDSSHMYEMLAPEIDGLEKLLNVDLSGWRGTPAA